MIEEIAIKINGHIMKIDKEDIYLIINRNIFISSGYACYKYNNESFRLHRDILKCSDDFEIDHINGDRLDNRRSNLRIATRSENSCNTVRKNNLSGQKGVSYLKHNKKWIAQISKNRKKYYLGCFESKFDAIKVYQDKAKELHGEFAKW